MSPPYGSIFWVDISQGLEQSEDEEQGILGVMCMEGLWLTYPYKSLERSSGSQPRQMTVDVPGPPIVWPRHTPTLWAVLIEHLGG